MMQYIQQMMCWMSKMMSRMMSQKILIFLNLALASLWYISEQLCSTMGAGAKD
jgi:hypothetical protein